MRQGRLCVKGSLNLRASTLCELDRDKCWQPSTSTPRLETRDEERRRVPPEAGCEQRKTLLRELLPDRTTLLNKRTPGATQTG